MKFKIVFLLLLISIKVSCQLDRLGKFYSEKLNDLNKNYSITFYKIKDNVYETDHKKYFAFNKNILFKNTTDDIIHFKIYRKKILIHRILS